MPFIRHARDKRGYESTVVMHAYRASNGASRARVLYLFRTPANLKVGRRALEPEVVEALEHTHPDLTFDWHTLLRESASTRVEPRERERDRERERWQRPGRSGGSSEGSRGATEASAPVIEDDSLLGRTVGAREAARLRTKYQELLQRILRRARTPEDRDRLTEHARRLNPEEWPDEAAIRSAIPTIDAEWTAIAAELPSRRRGRRGGRSRGEQAVGAPAAGDLDSPDGGIITGEGQSNEEPTDAFDAGAMGPDVDHADAGDGGGFRADAAETTDDAAETGAVDAEPAGTEPEPSDLPGGH